jgi:hypothetical protein
MRLLSRIVMLVACTAAAFSLFPRDGSRAAQHFFILADDLGYGDIEAFGGDLCNVDTPHFDALCQEGMKFTVSSTAVHPRSIAAADRLSNLCIYPQPQLGG